MNAKRAVAEIILDRGKAEVQSLSCGLARLLDRFHLFIVKHNPKDTWPFDQPRNCATFTTRQILDGSEPILLVSHDSDDHDWQFIGSSAGSVEDVRIIGLEEIVEIDPTVLEVTDLPPGWLAIRQHIGGPWTRRQQSAD